MAMLHDGTNLDELVPQLVSSGAYRLEYQLIEDPRSNTIGLYIRAIGNAREAKYGLMLHGGWHIVADGDRFPAFDVRDVGDRTFSEWHEGATNYRKIRQDLDHAILAKKEARERLEAMERRFDSTIATIHTIANNP